MSKKGICCRSLFLMFTVSCALGSAAANAQSYSRTETIVYHDNMSNWVLDQVASRSVNGINTEQTQFDAVSALPVQKFQFGKLQQTISYNADGTIATLKDGRNNITTLSGWHRGVPRTIRHPDGSSETVVVNDHGWITRLTDATGAVTNYSHDAMGRLSSIVYPTGDSTSWNTTTQTFVQVQVDEYGIPAGHWRQTVLTGAGEKVTYFDGLWRPLIVRERDTSNSQSTRFSRFNYDHAGRVTFASYPSSDANTSVGVRTSYDALGRSLVVTQNSEMGLLTTRSEYGPGLVTKVTNPRGFSTTTSYMAWDSPTYDYPVWIQSPEGAVTTITRDVFGKPVDITRGAAP